MKTGKGKGIVEAIQMSFEEIGEVDDLIKIFVAFGADGANTNSGDDDGAITLLKEKYGEWIVVVVCFPQVRIGYKRCIEGYCIQRNIYYMYEKSPKKLCELSEIHDSYKKHLILRTVVSSQNEHQVVDG